MFKLTLKEAKGGFFDRSKVARAVDRMVLRVLSRFGAFVRKRSRSSIRKRKAVSKPGSPPTNRTGLLKKNIFFSYEKDTKTVVIGPVALRARPVVPGLLETGGTIQQRSGRGDRLLRYRPRPYMAPAFEEELKKLPAQWRDQLRG